MSKPPILAIETSTNMGSVSVSTERGLFTHDFEAPHSQAAQLVPTIENALKDNDIWYNDLAGLAITIGPGSFTGIRIGLSVAQTIAFAHPDLAIYPFTTLECLAAGYTGDATSIHCTLRAGKGEIYYQPFTIRGDSIQSDVDIALITPDKLPDASTSPIVTGNTANLTADALATNYQPPESPSSEALMRAIHTISTNSERGLAPFYIRPPDAALPTKPPI